MPDKRRLIGIDLAWGKHGGTGFADTKCAGSGCVELAWNDGDLVMERPAVICYSMKQIVEWIEPGRDDWTIAVDVPLVVRNKAGMRIAERASQCFYSGRHAGARPSSLSHPSFGEDHRGKQIVDALQERGGELVEDPAKIGGLRVVFETYPHIAMVELFKLKYTIKYKRGGELLQRAGQRQLVDAILEHLCGASASPRLQIDGRLEELLREPLDGDDLKDREDKLDGLICAYTAAWGQASLPLQGLGKVGCGVIIAPAESPLGVRSCDDKVRRPRARKQRKNRAASAAAPSEPSDEPLCWQPEGLRTCCCGCGETVNNCFVSGHDRRVEGWFTKIQKGEMSVGDLRREVWRLNLNSFYNGDFADLDLGPEPAG